MVKAGFYKPNALFVTAKYKPGGLSEFRYGKGACVNCLIHLPQLNDVLLDCERNGQRETNASAAVCHWDVPPSGRWLYRSHG